MMTDWKGFFAEGGIWAALVGVGALWLRKILRVDNKEAAVDEGWQSIVAGLREDIEHLRASVASLEKKLSACNTDKENLSYRLAAFERKYGDRVTDKNA